MLGRILALVAALILTTEAAQAHRVALVIGQNAYAGGTSATVGLPPLGNPAGDAHRVLELLTKNGFEVISCDGKRPGCFDLDRSRLLEALKSLEQRASGADLALVFFAGHGMATEEGNILGPVDARVDCATGTITQGVPVERIIAATSPARMKLVILDTCRDNPLGEICPNLAGKKLSFTRIEAGALQGFLLVTSTQFGQSALDGLPGTHSPFATALITALEASPSIYFEQVMNEVARATYEAAQRQGGFLQIPGKVVGGAAPADCLTGKSCVGDVRMAALAIENERLAADAAGVRNLLAAEERTRGKPYNAEERAKRVSELEQTLARIGTSTDPLRQEARRLIGEGNVTGGQAKLDEALDADEKALLEAQRVAEERRKAAARSARDLAVLAEGTNIAKAVSYYQRATRLDPSDAQLWYDYGRTALDAGRTAEAKTAFEQAALKAQESNDAGQRYWAMLGLGQVAVAQGDLPGARQFSETAVAIAERIAKAGPVISEWQRNLSKSHANIGDMLVKEGDLPAALESFRASHSISERLVKADPGNGLWQRDLSLSHERIGDVLVKRGDLPAALESYRASHAIDERLAKADPGNDERQRDLSVSQIKIGDVLANQGNLSAALESFRASNSIFERLAKADPSNAERQRDLSVSQEKIGNMLVKQGNLSGALESYRASHAITERLAKADPSNAWWQRDLCVSHTKIGDVLVKQGQLPAALESFRTSQAIAERLAKADPTNVEWQRDLSVSHEKIGDVLRAQRNVPAALESFRTSQAIKERLAKADPTNVEWQREFARLHGQIAALAIAKAAEAGQYEEACKLQEALAASIEEAETKSDGKPGKRTAAALGSVAWRALFAKDFDKALIATDRAIMLAPDLLWITMNRGHALLFLDRAEEAKTLYVAHRGEKIPNVSDKLWEQVIADDFAEFRRAGITHSMMSTIEADLGLATGSTQPGQGSTPIAATPSPAKNGGAESAQPAEGARLDVQSRTASEGSLPAGKKVMPRPHQKAPMTWQQEMWGRQ